MPHNESGWIMAAANQVVSGVNSALAMSPGAQKHLKNLEQCVLKIQLSGLNSTFYFGVVSSSEVAEAALEPVQTTYKVQLVEPRENPDVSLSGSPLSFIKLLSQKNKASLFKHKELDLQGDAVRIQQIFAFLNTLEIDWDGLLANFIGDVPAHFIGSTLRTGLAWGFNFSQAFIRDAEEYIKYELRLLPDKARASKQFSAIADLAKDVETLKARFDKFDEHTPS